MLWLVSTVHVIVCLFLILVVLLHKLTVGAFVAFILTTMGIGLLKNTARADSVLSDLPTATEEATPQPATDEAPLATDESAAPTATEESTPADDATTPPATDEGASEPEPMDGSGDGQ